MSFLSALGSIGNAMLGGIPSAIGQGVAAIAGIAQQNSANRANMRLAQYQFDKNLEMWHMQNEYNTPANQMARYADAGLNKNLVYSQGTPGIAQSAPQYEAPEIKKYTNFGDFGMSTGAQAYAAMHQQKLNEELAKSQIGFNDAKTHQMEIENSRTYIQALAELSSMYRDENLHPYVKDKLIKESNLLEQKRKTEQSAESLNYAKSGNLAAQNNEIQKRCEKMESDMKLNSAKIREIDAHVEKMIAEAAKIRSDKTGVDFMNTLNSEQKKYLALQIKEAALRTEEERRLKHKDNTWYQARLQNETFKIFTSLLPW